MYSKAKNTVHIALLGRAAHQAQKKKKKQMPTTAARQSVNEPPPLRPPETNHHSPRLRSAAYQAAPSRRDATPTTLLPGRVLGFPPTRGGKWGMVTTDTLQEGMVAPVGVTASESDEPARISLALQTPPPNRSRPAKPPPNTMRHRGCAATHAVSLRAPTRGQEDQREVPSDGSSSTKAEQEGTTFTAVVREARASGTLAVAVRTRQRGIPGHPWPSQARNGPAKPRRPRCSRLASAPPAPSRSSPLPRLPEVSPQTRPAGPPRPKWGQ